MAKAGNTLAPIPIIGLNADDAAKSIGISKFQLQAMARRGEIPCVSRNKMQVYDPEDLKAWLTANKSKGESSESEADNGNDRN